MSTEAEYVLPEGFPTPTIYAKLMDVAIKSPLQDWDSDITRKVSSILDTFEKAGIEHLRKAYVAGVTDGYRQALVELEQAEHGR